MIDVILPNGKKLSESNSLDPSVILSLRNINRFPAHSINGKMNVVEHSFLCAMLAPSYCNFQATHFEGGKHEATFRNDKVQLMIMQAAGTHDLEEVVFNDIPTQIKYDELEANKAEVRKQFCAYLKMQPSVIDITHNVVKMAVHHIDKTAAFLEALAYAEINPKTHPSINKILLWYGSEVKKFGLVEWVTNDLNCSNKTALSYLNDKIQE